MNCVSQHSKSQQLEGVLVAHPLLQHSHQLASALHERNLLYAFWSGTPLLGPREKVPYWLPRVLEQRIKHTDIPRILRRHPAWTHLAMRIARLLPNGSADDNTHRIFHAFDYWVSRQLSHSMPSMVVAYENSAYHTFKEAHRLGIRCVLDAPSLHHRTSDLLINTPQTSFRKEINRRKSIEIELAEKILTCSSFAADSYIENGVSSAKLHPILLGAEIDNGAIKYESATINKKPVFVFAGGLGYRKSTDLILDVFERLQKEGHHFELLLVGSCNDHQLLNRVKRLHGAEHRPNQPQKELFNIFTKADCLLLPSRFDSFGMVVAEAMACGVPAIVSERTGAKEIITKFPKSGWTVKPTNESIYEATLKIIQCPSLLQEAKAAALEASKAFTWGAYRARVGDFFSSIQS